MANEKTAAKAEPKSTDPSAATTAAPEVAPQGPAASQPQGPGDPPEMRTTAMPATRRCVVTHGTVRHNGKDYPAGEKLDLTRAEFEPLKKGGVVERDDEF